MLFRDVIQLLSVVKSENDIGDTILSKVPRQVFANQKSIRQSEFYQAMATGLKPELMFEIRSIDYLNEETLEYNNKQYSIIRTYSKNGEMIELICQGLVSNATS